MPIVVRELVIRARVEEVGAAANGAGRPPASGLPDMDLQRIVSLCVEQVMDNLERQKER